MDSGHADIAATPHPIMSDSDWQQAHAQARVIVRLAEHGKVGVVTADAAAEGLGCSGDRYRDSQLRLAVFPQLHMAAPAALSPTRERDGD